MIRLQQRLRRALQGLAARACNDWHRHLVPGACPGVRFHLLGTTGQCRIATNDVWTDYECEEQQMCRMQSRHVAASESVALAGALYRATPPLSTANLTHPCGPRGQCNKRLPVCWYNSFTSNASARSYAVAWRCRRPAHPRHPGPVGTHQTVSSAMVGPIRRERVAGDLAVCRRGHCPAMRYHVGTCAVVSSHRGWA